MQKLIKPLFRYSVIVTVFGVAIHLIYLAVPLYMMIVYDRVLFSFSQATLATMIVVVILSLSSIGLIDYCRSKMLGQIANNLTGQLSPLVLRGMLQNATGLNQQWYSRGLFDLESIRDVILHGRLLPFFDLPWVLIYLGILLFIHPLIGGVTTGMLFLIVIFQGLLWIFEKDKITIADVVFQNQSYLASRNILHHAELVSAMGLLPSLDEAYRAGYTKILALRSESETFYAGIGALLRFLHGAILVVVFGTGAYVFFSEKISTGAIFAVVMVTARLLLPFERNFWDMHAAIKALAAYKRLHHFFNQLSGHTKLSLPSPEGKFVAENVSLATHGKVLVQNVTFAVPPGESVGITGPSGAGKTSLCKMLLGIWPATAGKIRLDDAEIDQWPEQELRQHIGYMPQEPELFPATIAENIARLQQVDSDKVVKAAQRAGVHEIILQLAQGYDTRIDLTEKNLSAGQRQLISLARAFYDEPKLVILDEPHTHLDDVGLKILRQALTNLKNDGVTTIAVTDRTNLLVNMDKILVMRDGQVALFGPSQAVFNQLANKQQSLQAAGA